MAGRDKASHPSGKGARRFNLTSVRYKCEGARPDVLGFVACVADLVTLEVERSSKPQRLVSFDLYRAFSRRGQGAASVAILGTCIRHAGPERSERSRNLKPSVSDHGFRARSFAAPRNDADRYGVLEPPH